MALDAKSEEQPLVFAGVRFDAEGVALFDGGRMVKCISRSDLQSIEMRHGFLSQHPFLQIVCGAGFVWLGCMPAKLLLNWFLEGGTMSTTFAVLVLFVPAGAWLIYDALKRGYFLILDSSTGGRVRFPFKGRPSDSEVKTFLSKVRTALGYEIIDHTGGG